MKKQLLLAVLLVFAVLIAGCGRTDYSYVYQSFDKRADYSGGNYVKYLVCYEPASDDFRQLLEDKVVSEIRRHNIGAVAEYTFFKNKEYSRYTKAQIQQLVTQGGFDAILVIGEQDNYKGDQIWDQLTGIANQTNNFARRDYQANYAKVYSVELGRVVWKTDVVLRKQVNESDLAKYMSTATAQEIVNWMNDDDLLGNPHNMLPQNAIQALKRNDSMMSIDNEVRSGLPGSYELKLRELNGRIWVKEMYPTSESQYVTLHYNTEIDSGRLNIVITDSNNKPFQVIGVNAAGSVQINNKENSGFKIYIVGEKASNCSIKLWFE